jgi:DNA modification methylase
MDGAPGHERSLVPDSIEPIPALLFLALFEALRAGWQLQQSSNPTWTKIEALAPRDVESDLHSAFTASVDSVAKRLSSQITSRTEASLRTASATHIPLSPDSIDMIVTSPPYATRIDYAMATLPELAALGWDKTDLATLRTRLLGTPVTSGGTVGQDQPVGHTALQFLDRVANHGSRASAGYYLKFFERYFAGLAASIREMSRVAKPGAGMAVVVQDSYYKEVRLDLARVLVELAARSGWNCQDSYDFPVHTMAAVNRGARSYRSNFWATESVLIFAKQRQGA